MVRSITNLPVGVDAELTSPPLHTEVRGRHLVDHDVEADILPVLGRDLQRAHALIAGIGLHVNDHLQRTAIGVLTPAIAITVHHADLVQQRLGLVRIIGHIGITGLLIQRLCLGIEVELDGLGAHGARGHHAGLVVDDLLDARAV